MSGIRFLMGKCNLFPFNDKRRRKTTKRRNPSAKWLSVNRALKAFRWCSFIWNDSQYLSPRLNSIKASNSNWYTFNKLLSAALYDCHFPFKRFPSRILDFPFADEELRSSRSAVVGKFRDKEKIDWYAKGNSCITINARIQALLRIALARRASFPVSYI